MTEDEYWNGEPEESDDDDSEFGDTFLSDEETDGDINVLIIPKLNYNLGDMIQSYLKVLKTCKKNDDAVEVLGSLCEQISLITIIENSYTDIQVRVLEMKELMEQVKIK
jgi:hypothetical protein